MAGRIEPELPALRKLAEEVAARQRVPPNTAHLIAAVAMRSSAAADLLLERRLDADTLLRKAPALTEEREDCFARALQRAREIAGRMGVRHTSPAHVLVAVLSEQRSAARRLVAESGVDVGRLRAAAMNVALGLIGRRRVSPLRREATVRSRHTSEQQLRGKLPLDIGMPPRPLAPLAGRSTLAIKHPSTAESVPVIPKVAPPKAKPRLKVAAAFERFQLDPQKFPTLIGLGKNLTLAAARGELDPVIGRDSEIEQTLDVLAKRQGNNPCLVGVAGVGKTSVVRGLAQRIAAAKDVASLDDRVIVEISAAELLAGTSVRGALATRFAALRKEVAASGGRVVLFFDEIHQLLSTEATEEIGGELKLALARGELPCIGATTFEEYRSIERDGAIARRFSMIEVDEPTREDAYLILDALRDKLEQHHRVRYEQEALALSVAWSMRYLAGRALPDKAIAIVDLAGARVRRRGGDQVGAAHVAEVLSDMADVPLERLLETDQERWLRLEELLARKVVGHEEQMQRMARILRRNAAGLGAPRPMGTFLLLGPTGVGKTETAKAVAEVLFHSENALTRIDMAEYGEPHSVARLIGSPPGYVGHDAGGQLTEAVRRRPYQVVLLDEIEKAHPDVLTVFLGLFDEGRLTDGRGRTVDFTNTVVFLTSNLGADQARAVRRRVGFGTGGPEPDLEQSRQVVAAARSALPPELYNRIDEVLAFAAINRPQAVRIAERLLNQLSQSLERHGIVVQTDAAAVELLLDNGGFDPELGVRPLKRAIARLLEAPLAEKILAGELSRGDTVLIGVEAGQLCFDALSDRPTVEELAS